MKTQAQSFKKPVDHIFFKGTFNSINMIRTEIQLRKLERDIRDLESYIKICTEKRNSLDKIRKECISWRLKHSNIK